jgi:multisubunit Na+/H+ antiporter MnhG subunit
VKTSEAISLYEKKSRNAGLCYGAIGIAFVGFFLGSASTATNPNYFPDKLFLAVIVACIVAGLISTWVLDAKYHRAIEPWKATLATMPKREREAELKHFHEKTGMSTFAWMNN